MIYFRLSDSLVQPRNRKTSVDDSDTWQNDFIEDLLQFGRARTGPSLAAQNHFIGLEPIYLILDQYILMFLAQHHLTGQFL
jgi:hypothetical protein